MGLLQGWDNFYVIVGSSAGALIGLQFVVISLIAEGPAGNGEAKATRAFASPTVLHFSAVLVLSAIASVPWDAIAPAATLWGLTGLGGLIYTALVARRMRAQPIYRPVLEDVAFHLLVPSLAYAVLLASACIAQFHPRVAAYGVAACALILLLTAIHNAWDMVVFNVFVWRRRHPSSDSGAAPSLPLSHQKNDD